MAYDQAKDQAGSAQEPAGKTVENAQTTAEDCCPHGAEQARCACGSITAEMCKATTAVSEQIKERPFAAVAIAAVIGYALGRLGARR
ncbi:MAG TPA: hypothetical protein VMI52_11245 [Acetobacteraceae bacterium]|nr:hypothetical protein [Acetobacteraceae bacterium]